VFRSSIVLQDEPPSIQVNKDLFSVFLNGSNFGALVDVRALTDIAGGARKGSDG